MKEIKLTQGKYALVDDEDFERVNQFKWHSTTMNYAKNNKIGFLHRFILRATNSKILVDHLNGNTLDNRKPNLRLCSYSENNRNRMVKISNKTGFKGVSFHKVKNKYEAKIDVNKKQYYIGYFNSPIEAAKAYNAKALELHGEFARLNIIPKEENDGSQEASNKRNKKTS